MAYAMDTKISFPVSCFPKCGLQRQGELRRNSVVEHKRKTAYPLQVFRRAVLSSSQRSRPMCAASKIFMSQTVEENTFLPNVYEMGAATWRELEQSSVDLLSKPYDIGDLAIRVQAAKCLDVETSWDIVDQPEWLDACSLIRGDIGEGQQLVDLHVRLVVDCLLRGDASATIALYDTLKQGPPFIAREKVAMHASVGNFTYSHIQDEQSIISSVLGDCGEVSPEAQVQLDIANAISDAVDLVAAIQPIEVSEE